MAEASSGVLALEGKLEEIKDLIATEGAPAALTAADGDGRTMLHWAASGGRDEVADFLLGSGAEPNATDDAGWTPLHVAASSGHAAITLSLLRAGANPLAVNTTGQLAIHYAASRNRIAVAQHLQEAAGENGLAMVSAADTSGSTPLMRSSARGYEPMTVWLLEAGAPALCKDRDGNTPLHLAAIEREKQMVGLLLEHGGPEQRVAKNNEGKTPHDCTKENAERSFGMPEYDLIKSLSDMLA